MNTAASLKLYTVNPAGRNWGGWLPGWEFDDRPSVFNYDEQRWYPEGSRSVALIHLETAFSDGQSAQIEERWSQLHERRNIWWIFYSGSGFHLTEADSKTQIHFLRYQLDKSPPPNVRVLGCFERFFEALKSASASSDSRSAFNLLYPEENIDAVALLALTSASKVIDIRNAIDGLTREERSLIFSQYTAAALASRKRCKADFRRFCTALNHHDYSFVREMLLDVFGESPD